MYSLVGYVVPNPTAHSTADQKANAHSVTTSSTSCKPYLASHVEPNLEPYIQSH